MSKSQRNSVAMNSIGQPPMRYVQFAGSKGTGKDIQEGGRH